MKNREKLLEHKRAAYRANKGHYFKLQLARRARFKAFIAWLKNIPCFDCGNTFPPECMDFDHVEQKTFNIGSVASGRGVGIDTLQAEIMKCELVCANCHRVRTKGRRNEHIYRHTTH